MRPQLGLFDNPVRAFSLDELVAEAIRMARAREARAEIAGSRWQASTREVRSWSLSAGFELGSEGGIPDRAITAYNQTHPHRPH